MQAMNLKMDRRMGGLEMEMSEVTTQMSRMSQMATNAGGTHYGGPSTSLATPYTDVSNIQIDQVASDLKLKEIGERGSLGDVHHIFHEDTKNSFESHTLVQTNTSDFNSEEIRSRENTAEYLHRCISKHDANLMTKVRTKQMTKKITKFTT